MDNLTGIRVFVRIVALNSLSGAARELGMSNAAVSKHLNRLEERLGAQLLNRTTRRISPTEAGRTFYERCVRIIDDLAEAELAVTELSGSTRGVLRVNMPMAFGRLHITPLLPEFMQTFPDLSLDVTMSDSKIDVVESGADVVIRISELADSTLVARRLASSKRIICASPAYLAQSGEPKGLDELSKHNCFRYAYHNTPHEWRLTGPHGEERVQVNGNLVINNSEAQLPALLSGSGIALIPEFIAKPHIDSGELQVVLAKYEDTRNAIYAVYPFTRHPQPKVRAFVEFLANRFTPKAPWEN